MKILISGYYGYGNIGDEAVLEALVQGLRGHDLTVLSPVDRYNWGKVLSAILLCDVLLSGGGSLLQNKTSRRSFFYYAGLILLAKIFGKRAVIFAQGFGPLNGFFSCFIARIVLNRADLITLRDKDSYQKVLALGVDRQKVHLTADVSLTLKIPSAETGKKLLSLEGISKGAKPLLGIAVREVPAEPIAKLIDWLVQEYDYTPVFLLFRGPEDTKSATRVMKLMQSEANVVLRACKPDEMLALVSQFDLIIAMRLHALIFAAMTAVPMLGISYDPKVESFMRSIDQPYLLFHEVMDFEHLKRKMEGVLINKEQIKKDLLKKREELREKADINFRALSALVPCLPAGRSSW